MNDNRYKFYILIRNDLDISIGKIMVHVGHLCTTMAHHYLCHLKRPDLLRKFTRWYFNSNQTKILLKVKDLEELRVFWNRARLQYGFMTFEVADAGYTEVEKGMIIMMGIEPIQDFDAGVIGLKELKLFR